MAYENSVPGECYLVLKQVSLFPLNDSAFSSLTFGEETGRSLFVDFLSTPPTGCHPDSTSDYRSFSYPYPNP